MTIAQHLVTIEDDDNPVNRFMGVVATSELPDLLPAGPDTWDLLKYCATGLTDLLVTDGSESTWIMTISSATPAETREAADAIIGFTEAMAIMYPDPAGLDY